MILKKSICENHENHDDPCSIGTSKLIHVVLQNADFYDWSWYII